MSTRHAADQRQFLNFDDRVSILVGLCDQLGADGVEGQFE
ncbi:MAG: hypothetical protein J07HQX50_02388 [Haloquadratum sp. J07HQX50]|nr:MAG: hypothetical protein J07HQX50_02388 [Haloquadratum sp. J07HQX50]